MNFLNYLSHTKTLLKAYKSCSLVNSDGSLLFSKDLGNEALTTTRLVAFQIVKKYLNPKPLDFFILNDPENGGYHYSKLIFITCLDANLFLIWDVDCFYIDFKIPPTPLFDQGKKNEFVWQALTSANSFGEDLESLLVYQKHCVDQLNNMSEQLKLIASVKNQQAWLKTTQEVFNLQFDSKAHGSFEALYKTQSGQNIKLKFSAEEKQNIRLLTLDFTNTSLATDFHTSSHVIESALLKRIIDFYQINNYFSQAVLDKIKVILPPKSIVSKPHALGEYNYELQNICSQLFDYNTVQLNAHTRKSLATFDYCNYLNLQISHSTNTANIFLSAQNSYLNQFEDFVEKKLIHLLQMSKNEQTGSIRFQVSTNESINLKVKNNYSCNKSDLGLKINEKAVSRGLYNLKKDDIVEITIG